MSANLTEAMENASPVPSPSGGTASNGQWRVFLGLALLVGSFLGRVEIVRFTLHLARRAAPGLLVWIKQFEKTLLRPLSWVVFVLLVWFCTYVMDLGTLLHIKSSTIKSIVALFIAVPLIWTVICFCNYVTWGIIRVKGWSLVSNKSEDDYNRVMIITEGINVIKIILVAAVVFSFMINAIGEITNFDSSEISTVAILVVEIVLVFGGHTWLKNVMGGLIALLDEQIKSGSHIRFLGHEGVVDGLFLQCFSLRQYDKGLVYIPNGLLLEHSLEYNTKMIDRQATISIRVHHSTSAAMIRTLIQELDGQMMKLQAQSLKKRRGTVMGLERKPRGWDILDVVERAKEVARRDEQEDKPWFWISVTAPHVIDLVYYSQEQHMKPRMAEKTELILQISELVASLGVKLHNDGVIVSNSSDSSKAIGEVPPAHAQSCPVGLRHTLPDEETLDLSRAATDSNVLRRRRPHAARM